MSSGWYLFMESSKPNNPGDKARLRSEILSPTTGSCFSFWYSMYGATVGTLNVYQDTYQTFQSGIHSAVYTKQGDQGQAWQQAFINITSTVQYTIAIDAIVGNGYTGDMGVDDITLTTGLCTQTANQNTYFNCGGQQTVPSNKVCDFTPDCVNGADEMKCGNCTFENGDLCNWHDRSVSAYR